MGEQLVARWYDVGPTFFTTLGVPLLRGRPLAPGDTQQSTPVAVVNQTMARRFWPQGGVLGSRVTMYGRTMTVVGIVADVTPLTPGAPPGPEIFWPQQQAPRYASFLLVRTDGNRPGTADAIRDRIAVLNPDVHVSGFTLVDELLERRLVSPKFNAVLLVTFAGVAVLLATVGIYALLSYVVAQRNKEIAVRLALGASRRSVMTDVWRRAMVLTAIGVATGWLGAVAFGRMLEGMLPGVAAADVRMLVAVAAGMVVVATLASVTPARRLLRLHPMIALRGE